MTIRTIISLLLLLAFSKNLGAVERTSGLKGENNFPQIVPKLEHLNSDLAKLSSGDARKFNHAKYAKTFASAPIAQTNQTAVVQSSPKVGSYGWVEYYQCDPSWAWQQLGWCEGCSICYYGCAMTSVAMMLATKGIDVNPSTLDIWLSDNGGYYDGCGLLWAYADAFGVTSFQGLLYISESEICDGLSAGHGIIANVNNGEHWVLLTACLGGGVFAVNDPAGFKSAYSIDEILMEAVYY